MDPLIQTAIVFAAILTAVAAVGIRVAMRSTLPPDPDPTPARRGSGVVRTLVVALALASVATFVTPPAPAEAWPGNDFSTSRTYADPKGTAQLFMDDCVYESNGWIACDFIRITRRIDNTHPDQPPMCNSTMTLKMKQSGSSTYYGVGTSRYMSGCFWEVRHQYWWDVSFAPGSTFCGTVKGRVGNSSGPWRTNSTGCLRVS